jgi:alpha-beta hydrolase superfamily lysophospholipase
MVLIHGLNIHCNGVAIIAKTLAPHGIETVGFDLRHFGRSESAKRGKFDSVEPMVNDCINFIEHVKQTYTDQPIFLIGQSLGGYLALRASLVFKD